MKKLLLMVAAIVALSLVGCKPEAKKVDYKAEGARYAAQLDSLCQKQDTVAVRNLVDSIRVIEEQIAQKATAQEVNDFNEALMEARHNAAVLTATAQVQHGTEKKEAVQQVINQALNGEVSIKTVTTTIDAVGTDSVK